MGVYAFIISLLNFGFMFFDMGLDSIHYQYSSKPNFSDFFGTFFAIKLLLLLVNICFTLFIITLLQLWNQEFIEYILIFLSTIIIKKLIDVFIRNLKSKKKIFKSEIPVFFLNTIYNILIIYLILNVSSIQDPLLYLSLSNLIVQILLLLSIIIISKENLRIKKPSKIIALNYVKDAKPLIFFSILYVITEYMGNLLLFYFFGSEVLAYFTIVNSTIIASLLIISNSISDIYQIYYSECFEKNDTYSIQKTTHIIEKYSSILYLSIIIIILLNAELILSIFLPNYMKSLPILYILIFIPYIFGISLPYVRQMVSGKKQKELAIFDTFNRCFMFILLIILIPKKILFFSGFGLGVLGYAFVLIINRILISIACRIFSKKFFNIKSQKNIVLHLLFASFCLIFMIWIKNTFLNILIQNQLILLFVTSVLALGIFLGELFIFKELKKEDIRFFLELLNFKRYLKSLKEEF